MDRVYIAECFVETGWDDCPDQDDFNLGIFDDLDKAIKACDSFDPMNEVSPEYMKWFNYDRWIKTSWYISEYKLNTGKPVKTTYFGEPTEATVWKRVKTKEE